MSLTAKELNEFPPWEWPEDAGEILLSILRDAKAVAAERLLAAELAGDCVVINDEIAAKLLSIVEDDAESDEMRARAAISLGPALEHGEVYEFDDPDDFVISEIMFERINRSLPKIYLSDASKLVKRRVFEAAVRAPQEWQHEVIRTRYTDEDEEWKLSAVFGARFVRGFDDIILDALNTTNEDILLEAVYGARNWEIEAAWPYILSILNKPDADKSLTLVAIEAAGNIRPKEAIAVLGPLLDSDDEEIVDQVHEVLAIAGAIEDDEDDEFDED